MSDWFSTAIAMQREIIRAQQAQIDAARRALDLGKQGTELQEGARKATGANMKAMKAWASLWGWK